MALKLSIAERRKRLGVSAADVAADKAKRTSAITAKQKAATAQPVNKFKETFQATKRAKPAEKKLGILDKIKGVAGKIFEGPKFTDDPSKKGVTIKDPTRSIVGAIAGIPLLATAVSQIGSGFGAAGKWVSAKNLKLGQVTPVGKLTTIGKGVTATSKNVVQTNAKTAGIFKSIFAKLTTATKTVTTTNPITGKVTVSAITEQSMAKPLVLVGATLAGLAYIAEKTFGGKNFAGFLGKEEASQSAGMAVFMAQSSDNYEEYLNARALQEEILDPSKMNEATSLIPYKNVADGITDYADATRAAGAIMDKIMLDRENAATNGTSIGDQIKQNQDEKAAQDKANIDYYNEQNLIYQDLKRQAEIDARNEDAAFWQKQADLTREKEEEDRQAIADFWSEYAKMKLQISDDNRPSNLKFGLL